MIRRIVTSETYRQSSRWRNEAAEDDPLNIWLARQTRFRLEAEVVRDVALSASGLLNPRIGGPSFKPALPRDLADLNYANGLKWDPASGAERYRRGLYIHFQRTVPYPMLMSFDAPESTATCTRRERSNSPLQALTLLNNELFVDCARALGERMLASLDGPGVVDAAIRRGFEIVTSRPAAPAELDRLREFWQAQRDLFVRSPESARQVNGAGEKREKEEPGNRRQESSADRGSNGSLPNDGNEARTDARLAASTTDPATSATAVAVARVLLNLEEAITRE